MKNISLLGATGSIGINTLKIIQSYPDKFQLVAFTFHSNIEKAREIIDNFQPIFVGAGTEELARQISKEYPTLTVDFGMRGLITAATLTEVDIVLTAVVGSVGVEPTLAAIKAKKEIALANKETLVMAGSLVMEAAKENNVSILPVDSEHSAIFQCLQNQNRHSLDSLWLTASGGSFRDLSRDQLKNVTIQDALQHPNWSMGKKITIDSATMMNKGLEVIEAHWLFGVDYNKINVVLHRESVVHSLIELVDGAYLAQLGASDMREPIQYALTYPERLPVKQPDFFSLTKSGALHFEEVDEHKYPLLPLAFEVGTTGGIYPTVLNAANEVAVSAFLNGQINYLDIEYYIQKSIAQATPESIDGLETLLSVDSKTRKLVSKWIKEGTI